MRIEPDSTSRSVSITFKLKCYKNSTTKQNTKFKLHECISLPNCGRFTVLTIRDKDS